MISFAGCILAGIWLAGIFISGLIIGWLYPDNRTDFIIERICWPVGLLIIILWVIFELPSAVGRQLRCWFGQNEAQ